MNSTTTFYDVLAPGEQGDATLDVRLTARQGAAIQLVITMAQAFGITTSASLGALEAGVGDAFSLALKQAVTRLGQGIASALGNEEAAAEFAKALDELDSVTPGAGPLPDPLGAFDDLPVLDHEPSDEATERGEEDGA